MTTETTTLLNAGAEPTDAATTSTAQGTTTADTTAAAGTTATAAPGTDAAKAAEAGATTAAEGKPGEGDKPPEGAPEKYADFKAPEGATLAPELVTEVSTLAKELNLSQDKAQKVLDTAVKLAKASADTSQQTIAETIKTTHAQWVAEVKADKEIGGDKLAENLAKAKAAMEATSTPQLQVLLKNSGLGNHPEVIRHFLKIAPAFAEGKHVPGDKSQNGGKSAAKVLYPNHA